VESSLYRSMIAIGTANVSSVSAVMCHSLGVASSLTATVSCVQTVEESDCHAPLR